jgi:hypothetical protein
VTEAPHIITPGGPIGRPGAMQGKPLRGRTATAHDYTTDTRIASHASTNTRNPTRSLHWEVTRLASLSPPRAIP